MSRQRGMTFRNAQRVWLGSSGMLIFLKLCRFSIKTVMLVRQVRCTRQEHPADLTDSAMAFSMMSGRSVVVSGVGMERSEPVVPCRLASFVYRPASPWRLGTRDVRTLVPTLRDAVLVDPVMRLAGHETARVRTV